MKAEGAVELTLGRLGPPLVPFPDREFLICARPIAFLNLLSGAVRRRTGQRKALLPTRRSRRPTVKDRNVELHPGDLVYGVDDLAIVAVPVVAVASGAECGRAEC